MRGGGFINEDTHRRVRLHYQRLKNANRAGITADKQLMTATGTITNPTDYMRILAQGTVQRRGVVR